MLGFPLQVAFAAEAVKGLRCAPMNSANYKTVRFALDCLPRFGWEGKQDLLNAAQKLRVSSLMIVPPKIARSACDNLVAQPQANRTE